MLSRKGLTSYELTEVQKVTQSKGEQKALSDLNRGTGKDFKVIDDFVKSYSHAEPEAAGMNYIKQFIAEHPGKLFRVDENNKPHLVGNDGADQDSQSGDADNDGSTNFKTGAETQKAAHVIEMENDMFFNSNPDASLIKDRLMAEAASQGKTVGEVYYANKDTYKDSIQLVKLQNKDDDDNDKTVSNSETTGQQKQQGEDGGDDEDGGHIDEDGVWHPGRATWNV